MIQVNETVPNFTYITSAGIKQFYDLKGKKVALYFYPKDNTPGCTIEAKGFRDHLTEFTALNTIVLGVSKDSLSAHTKFTEKCALPFPLISDTETTLCQLFGVLKEKSMFGKKYMGIERSTFLIDEESVLIKEWRKVNFLTHVQQVLAELAKAR